MKIKKMKVGVIGHYRGETATVLAAVGTTVAGQLMAEVNRGQIRRAQDKVCYAGEDYVDLEPPDQEQWSAWHPTNEGGWVAYGPMAGVSNG